MTQFMMDCSRHQVERPDPLSLPAALAAGFGIVNIQLDRGRQADVLPAWAPGYAAAARSLGLGISTYRWLDGRLSGAESARRAYERMVALGGPDGMAHIVDCEETADKGPPATEQIVRDYLTTMQGFLGRWIGLYTGDWWWTAPGRNWSMAGLTPYLHAAPNAGYQSSYPGDSSPHWRAGYGGWMNLSLMQYGVAPLPGTGDCSLTAIRDPAVWAALTGKGPLLTYADPALIDARKYLMGRGIPGNSLGIVGDQSHQSSGGYHVGNDILAMIGKLLTDYSKRQTDKDRPGSNAAMALDIGGLSAQQLYALTAWIIAQCRAGTADTRNIREVIGRRSPAGGVILYDALGIRAEDAGTADHESHTHISYYRDSEGGDKTSLFRRYFEPAPQKQEEEMPLVFFAKLAGIDTVHLVDSFMTNRFVSAVEFPILKSSLAANGIGTTVWEWPNTPAHQQLLGVNLDPIDDDPAPLLATLTPEQLEELGLRIQEGVPTLEQIRVVVDQESLSPEELARVGEQS